ncbi:hypothetical protein BN2475_340172 [Paraburkholderia ribeironis]|uniref:Uncharacterized protein n=1 Tax=Paraburkholderia ribeironis TaxID=1247936 RepID=A0A1N7S5F3_9BURK|nr:hypothetical protein [Paraburkholderia ribeironis]SIT42232.1 hypothetical protein BN2475_340172 [Paraburkholderia ribeironis]
MTPQTLHADALNVIERALNDYNGGFDAKTTVENIARVIGYPLTAGAEA